MECLRCWRYSSLNHVKPVLEGVAFPSLMTDEVTARWGTPTQIKGPRYVHTPVLVFNDVIVSPENRTCNATQFTISTTGIIRV